MGPGSAVKPWGKGLAISAKNSKSATAKEGTANTNPYVIKVYPGLFQTPWKSNNNSTPETLFYY